MIFTKEMVHSSIHIQRDLWETPDKIFNPLNEKFHFTLDPCCTFETRKAVRYYTPESNGLNQSWAQETVFCNPPYSRSNIDQWVYKIWMESESAKQCRIVALLPVSTSSKWFHDFVYHKCEIEFIKGRLKFKGAPYTAPFSSMLCYYNL